MKILMVMLALVLSASFVCAVDFDEDLSEEDKNTFDGILEPVMKVYNFIKYAASILAVLFLIFTGLTFIMSGNDSMKRESAKSMGMSIVIGLIIIWVAPLIVNYLV